MHANLNEHNLIRELKRGSQKAFNDIYNMYAKRLYAFCLQYAKMSEDAEEIVQDVFVQLWTKRENIRQEETLRSLLFIMAKHHLINAYKATLNSLVYEDYADYRDKLADDSYDHLEYEAFVGQLHKALGQLPPTQQKVIELSRLEGLSNSEVAERLSLSQQTVKNQLSLGLKQLRSILDKMLIFMPMLYFVNLLNYAVQFAKKFVL